ncbi:MAG: hypothetical protein ACRD2L_15585, partial [Terriglobia bacterium]
MTEKERYAKAKEIFLQAAEINAHDRDRYVAWACAGNRSLYQEVLRLLKGDFQSSDSWEETVRAS